MIQKLIQQIITLLQDGFTGVITDPANHIVAGPISSPDEGAIPMIVIYLDKLAIGQNTKETSSSQPRPQEMREEIPVSTSDPQGPYSLSKTPLEKSALCNVIFNKGALTEQSILLSEDKDFTIDYQNSTILFDYDISKADNILLRYSFVGIFTIREFEQDFVMDVYDENMADIEKWASLANTMILTNHDELIKNYNFTDITEYVANRFICVHTIDRIDFLSGIPDTSEKSPKFQFRYHVQGQIKPVKEIVEGFGLIKKIHSPGRISEHPVDIEVGLK